MNCTIMNSLGEVKIKEILKINEKTGEKVEDVAKPPLLY